MLDGSVSTIKSRITGRQDISCRQHMHRLRLRICRVTQCMPASMPMQSCRQASLPEAAAVHVRCLTSCSVSTFGCSLWLDLAEARRHPGTQNQLRCSCLHSNSHTLSTNSVQAAYRDANQSRPKSSICMSVTCYVPHPHSRFRSCARQKFSRC